MIETMSFTLVMRDLTAAERGNAGSALSVMGEEDFRAFYERTARPLWSYLSRITGDQQRADDLLQETYYRFYRAAARHESESHRRNSLFQIATNLVRDAARRSRGHKHVPLEDESAGGTELIAQSPVPEREVATRTDLARAMSQLEPLQRELLWLAYAQGESHEDIARILGLRAISIRTMLYRARKKLAAILSAGGEVHR